MSGRPQGSLAGSAAAPKPGRATVTLGAPANPVLREHYEYFAFLAREVERCLSHLDEEQFNWRPHPEAWSLGQCITHLNLSGERFLAVIEQLTLEVGLAGLRARAEPRRTRLGDWFLRASEPPVRRKFRALPATRPPAAPLALTALDAFAVLQLRLETVTAAADGLDLGAARERLSGPIVMTLGQWIALAAVHERRHAWQMRRILADPLFPHYDSGGKVLRLSRQA